MHHRRRPTRAAAAALRTADGEADAKLVILFLVIELAREHEVDSRLDVLLEHGAARGVGADVALEDRRAQLELVPKPKLAQLAVIVLHLSGERHLLADLREETQRQSMERSGGSEASG